MRYESDNTLIHWGIKGQQWGVRRFQNEDGSYTPAGKDRYGRGGSKNPNEKISDRLKTSSEDSQRGVIRTVKEAIFPKLKEQRLQKSKKEIDNAGLTDRFSDDDLDHYSKQSNSAFRKQVLNDMKKNPDLAYKKAYQTRLAKNVGAWAAMSLVTIFALPKFLKGREKAQEWLEKKKKEKRRKAFAKLPDIIDLRDTERTSIPSSTSKNGYESGVGVASTHGHWHEAPMLHIPKKKY